MRPFCFSFESVAGEAFVAVVTKRAWLVGDDGALGEAVDVPVAGTPQYADSGELLVESDLHAPLRCTTDVIVRGAAHSHQGPVQALHCSVAVGAAFSALRVTGDREIVRTRAGSPRFSAPMAFRKMPLSWSRAYGGQDVAAERARRASDRAPLLGIVAYPRNPWGKGFAVAPTSDEPRWAPNLDDPSDPVEPSRLWVDDADDWTSLPRAVGFGPVDLSVFPRCCYWMVPFATTPQKPVEDLPAGFAVEEFTEPPRRLPRTTDGKIHVSAPGGLGHYRLVGGETALLENLHPLVAHWRFEVPRYRPGISLQFRGHSLGQALGEIATLVIEPERSNISITYATTMRVGRVLSDEQLDELAVTVA